MTISRILLHICCGPCATYPVPALLAEGFEVTGYYFNPNIHPYQEWMRRRQAVAEYADKTQLRVIYADKYNPLEYMQAIAYRESRRCLICYQMRLEQAARIAKRGKFDYFSSTLLVSKYQQHDAIRQLGEEAGHKYGVRFLYRDFRVGFRESGANARAMGLYRQPYCGCLYSEVERYAPPEVRNLLKQAAGEDKNDSGD